MPLYSCILSLVVLVYDVGIQGVLIWTVDQKVTSYGENLTLLCNVTKCCSYYAGWDLWNGGEIPTTLFIDIKTHVHSDLAKYGGDIRNDGFTLIIRNLSVKDVNVSYACVYGNIVGDQILLLEEDIFNIETSTTISSTQEISEGFIAVIISGAVVCCVVILILIVWKTKQNNRRHTYKTDSRRYEGDTISYPGFKFQKDSKTDEDETCSYEGITLLKDSRRYEGDTMSYPRFKFKKDSRRDEGDTISYPGFKFQKHSRRDEGDTISYPGYKFQKDSRRDEGDTISYPGFKFQKDSRRDEGDTISYPGFKFQKDTRTDEYETFSYEGINILKGSINGGSRYEPTPVQDYHPGSRTSFTSTMSVNRGLSIHQEQHSAIVIEDEFPWIGRPDDWDKLLAFGTFQSFENRVYLCGCCSCGKSTLASVLIGESIPMKWKSTDGLVIYFGRNGIDLETDEMIPLKEGERGHSVLAKIIRGQPTVSNASSHTDIKQKNVPCMSISTNSSEPSALLNDQHTKASEKRKTNDTHYNDNEILQSYLSLSKKEKHVVIDNCDSTDLLQIKKVESYAVHNEILEEIRKGKYRIDIAPSDLVDFGGQRSYDMTHQLFIQHSGSFVVMFDGSKAFTTPLEVYSPGNITAQNIVKHWVNSILTYCVEEDDFMPKILFAATHSDHFATQEERECKKKEFIQKLNQLFCDHDLSNHIVSDTVFFMNCTNPGDPEIRRLTNHLVEIAKNQPSWGERRPIIWVPLELQISKMKMDNVNIITKSDLDKANQMNGDLALDEKQLEDFLLAQHCLGKIMYFKDQGLSDFIIIHPPALVNILRAFVTDEMFWPKEPYLQDILQTLTETGKLYKRDLLNLWQQEQYRQYLPFDYIVQFVVNVLIHLDVLVVPKTYPERLIEVVDYFLVPCVVKPKMSTEFLQSKSFEDNTITLVYRMKRSFLPSALSFKLIGAVSNIWPVKERDGVTLLYHSSAVLCVNKENEFRVITEDNNIVVYLTNRRSKAAISPDIAASIQECMTTTLKAVMQFYLINIGKYRKEINVSDLFHIEIGEVCDRSPCVKPVTKIKEMSKWECSHGNQHHVKYPMYWFFNKRHKECPPGCRGLDKDALALTPSDKHIARLAALLNINDCKVIAINLGLTENNWIDIEYEYDRKPLIVKIMALLEWRKNKHNSTLGDFSDKLYIVKRECHLMCKILREDTELKDQASPCLQEIPSDEVLYELHNHIGNCAVQLGIELELEMNNIIDSLTKYPRDIKNQVSDILGKWRRSKVLKPTIYRLMLALERVDNGGLDYLKDQYNCN